jgi:trk system potassium uptake protein TrkA
MRKQVVVIGLGRFGWSLAKTLFDLGNEVLAIDIAEKPVQSISSHVSHAVQADSTDETVLKELGISNFDVAAVAIGSSIQDNVLTTLLLKKLGLPYVIARAENDLHSSILEKIGADKVVYVEHETGISVAHGLTLLGVQDYVSISDDYGVIKLTAPAHFAGETLSSLGLGRDGKWKIAVLLMRRKNEIIVMPDVSELVQPEDILLLSGKDDLLEKALSSAAKKLSNENKEIDQTSGSS